MTALFITILNMSITASVVALAVMLARIPLRKAPKFFSYALWGVVLFRLVFPFSIESIFSLMPTSANAIQHNIIVSQNPTIQTGIQFIDAPVNATLYNAQPLIESGTNPIHTALTIAGYIWLIGFIALLVYATIGYVRLKRRVYFATLVRDNIFETDKIKSPFVLGFIHPKIYFPTTINPMQYDYILKHEQTHIKRRDYLIKPFAFIALALHWFNPIIWLSYALMSKDMEMSCDEAVLRNTNEDIRGDYSTSLLSLSVERVSLLNPIAFAFGESNVKERVVNVLSFKKHSKWVIAVSFVAVSIFLVGFTSDRVAFAEIPSELNNVAGANTANVYFQTMPQTPQSEQLAEQFEIYREFGLIFDPVSEHLYFNGVLVRYFTDMIPFPDPPHGSESVSFGVRHFTESGTVDVRAIRDFSQIALQGIIDIRSGLLGLEAFTQAEFDARNVDPLINSGISIIGSAGSAQIAPPLPDNLVTSYDVSGEFPALPSSPSAEIRIAQPFPDNQGIQFSGSGVLPTLSSRHSAEIFSEYEEWGLTFEGFYPNHDGGFRVMAGQNVFFQEQLVRGLVDFSDFGIGMSLSSFDRSGDVWVYVIRDENGYISELNMVQA